MPTDVTNPTEDDLGLSSIQLVPTPLGATVFVELIIIDPTSGVANLIALTTTGGTCDRDCDHYSGFKFTRDLYPTDYEKTVQSVLNSKGRKRADYVPYYRDYNTNALTAASYDDFLRNRRSLIYVHNTLTAGQLTAAMQHIATHREILPSRMPK